MLSAAFVNTAASHALDYDDCSTVIGGHPSAPLVAPVLALSEWLSASGADALDAYVAGFETQAALGRMAMPEHYEIGWHPTATFGIFGATAACAKLLRLDTERMATAFCIAVSMTAGVKANFGSDMKPLQVAMAARNGLWAALLVISGCTAKPDAFESEKGWFTLFNNGALHEFEDSADGRRWHLLDPGIAIKQHPCCGSAHSAIDAAVEIFRDRGSVALAEVERVSIRMHPKRLGHTNNPHPESGLAGKFSSQFLTATALANGRIRLDDFAEPFDSAAYLAEASKITIMPTAFDDEFRAEVEVERDGETFSAAASTRLGRGIDNSMTREERDVKFDDCVSGILSPEARETLRKSLRSLDHSARISDVCRELAGSAAQETEAFAYPQ
jgi:2-methylcitrate dehydratase PrpD